MAIEAEIREQALDWAVRAGDPAFADWEAFTLWLEADAAHAQAYDDVSVAISETADLIVDAGPGNDNLIDDYPASPRTRRAWLGGAFAACLALVAGFWLLHGEQRNLYVVQTALGETREITLDPGTRVALAGGTTVRFDRNDKRFAQLDEGQALFTVRHDAARPFEVLAGDRRLVDIGTVFDVRHDGGDLTLAVSEGAVQFDPGGADVRVSPGQVLRQRGTGYSLDRIPPARVGEWREGRLTFDAAPITEVADRLKRATGIDYGAAAVSDGTVSGSILVAPLRRNPAALGPLLGLSVRAEGKRWVIGAK